jgi:hypothetical protein
LVNRLKLFVNNIISKSQSSAIPNSSIFDTLHLLHNVFDYYISRKNSLLSSSFRPKHSIFLILDRMGLGPSFISRVKQLYNCIFSRVLVNCFLTHAAWMRTIPLLFNIAIEPLLTRIKQSLLFIALGGLEEERVVCYADDTAALVRNEASGQEVMSLFDNHSKASGVEISRNKTLALRPYDNFKQSPLPLELM